MTNINSAVASYSVNDEEIKIKELVKRRQLEELTRIREFVGEQFAFTLEDQVIQQIELLETLGKISCIHKVPAMIDVNMLLGSQYKEAKIVACSFLHDVDIPTIKRSYGILKAAYWRFHQRLDKLLESYMQSDDQEYRDLIHAKILLTSFEP